MPSEIRSAGSFFAKDAAGDRYEILIEEEWSINETRGGEKFEALLWKRLRTADGRDVSRDEQGRYTIFGGCDVTQVTSADGP